MSCVQSTVVEPAENILNRHTVQGLTDRLVQAVLRPRRDPAKLSLELRPQLLDRVVVRAVWRQGQDSRPCTLDRLRHVPREVGFEVVEDHHVPWAEFRDQYLIHIGLERLRVGRPGENQRRPHTIQTQRRDHRRRTPRGGDRADGPLAPRRPSVGRRHRRVDARLVDEYQAFRVNLLYLPPISPSLGLYLGIVPLTAVQGLLLGGLAEPAEGAPDGRQGAGEAAPLLQLVQGGIGMLGDQHRQSYLFGETEDRPRPAAVGLGGQGAGVPTPLEQSGDERDTDAESLGDLTLGAFALIDRRRNTLPEIHRIGSHGQPPSAPRPCQEDSCVPYYRIIRKALEQKEADHG